VCTAEKTIPTLKQHVPFFIILFQFGSAMVLHY
jgi:hypothetical protein